MEAWIIIAIAAFLAAGTVKGTLGIGMPIAAVGLMAQFIEPRLTITLMVFPIMFSNVWQIYRAGKFADSIRKYWLFAVVLVVVLTITTFYTGRVSANLLTGFAGIVVILFSLMNLVFKPPPLEARFERPGQIIGGLLAGIMGGLTAIWSPPIMAFLIARNVEKDEFIRATGFLFFVGSLPLCVGFWQNGMLTGPIALVSMGMILPTIAGFSLGEVIRRRLHPERFKAVVLVFFLLMGINLLRKAVTG